MAQPKGIEELARDPAAAHAAGLGELDRKRVLTPFPNAACLRESPTRYVADFKPEKHPLKTTRPG